MPRTGSSFLCQWFKEEGPNMTPACYSDNMPTNEAQQFNLNFQLCEPITFTHELSYKRHMGLDVINSHIETIEEKNKHLSGDREQVLKLSPLVFYRSVLNKFSHVIICMRDVNSWIKSAENHGSFAWINKVRPYWLDPYWNDIVNSENPYKKLTEIWSRACEDAFKFCVQDKMKIPCSIYNYADDQSFAILHKAFGLKPKKHSDYSYWIGRRF